MRMSRFTLMLLAGLSPLVLAAQSTDNTEIKKQIDELKKQVASLEEKAKDQDKTLSKVETKVAQDNIAWGGDLLTRLDSLKWHINPYKQFMGFGPVPTGPMAGMPMAKATQMPAQDLSDSVEWSTRLRLRMTIPINENAKIMGRLSMYKTHGGSDVPIFNGSPDTVATSSSAAVPIVDTTMGTPARTAAAAMASSPSGWAIRSHATAAPAGKPCAVMRCVAMSAAAWRRAGRG